MSKNYFDTNILKGQDKKTYPIVEKYKDFKYVLRSLENFHFEIYCEIDSDRLNPGELNALLTLNESKKFLSESDVRLITHLIHKLGIVQTIHKVIGDVEIVFSDLEGSNQKIIFNDSEIKFAKKDFKFNMEVFIDESSNVEIKIIDSGEFFFGVTRGYFLKDNILYHVNQTLPLRIYKEFVSGKNKFPIEIFLDLKDTLIYSLKNAETVSLSEDVKKLFSMNVETKVAPIVIEIGKSAHFINMNFRYQIGEDLFPVDNYKYFETINWLDKKSEIKVVKEENKLLRYVCDETFSKDVISEIFEGIRIRYSSSEKTPFQILVPISNLDVFTNKIVPKIEELFDIKYKDGRRLDFSVGRINFEIDSMLKRNLNLFEFKVKFKVGEEYFDLDFLKELMQKNKKFIQLKDGSTVNIENIREINKWIEFLNKFEFKKSEGMYKTEQATALELDEFLKDMEGKTVKSNDEYKNLIMELKDRTPIEEIDMPENTRGILRDYQKEGVYWLHFLKKYGFGGILADEMGLGKTIQALTVLDMNRVEGVPHIVICPKSLIYNWENEVKKYYPHMKVLIVDNDSDKRKRLIAEIEGYDIVITSYSMLQKDYVEYIDVNAKFNYAILDEAHYVKNMKTLSSKAVRLIPARRKVLLTGTPLENNLDELYGTFELIMPGYLGSKLEFRRDFVSKVERNNMIALEILQAKIRPFILRRTKKEVLKELPDKQEQIVYNEMTNKQVAVYSEVLNRVKDEVNKLVQTQGFDRSRIQVLSALLKLRQVCNHPSLIDDTFKGEQDISGKYNQFLELLTEVIEGGEKVLVFSQFTSMLNIFEKDLNEKGITFVRLDGSTKNRQEVVDRFNDDDDIKVFLISLKAGGVGLNLTSASAVFLYDPWWNPMAEQQAVDRAHRIGQTKKVNIYKFITKNSIEEKILKLQERKGNLFENIVVEDNGVMKKLEWQDLMELFEE